MGKNLPGHDWFIEFSKEPDDIHVFSQFLDDRLRSKNIYYNDLVNGKIIRPLNILRLKRGAFNKYMSSIGKLGGQNKCPQISNDRKIGDYLINFTL